MLSLLCGSASRYSPECGSDRHTKAGPSAVNTGTNPSKSGAERSGLTRFALCDDTRDEEDMGAENQKGYGVGSACRIRRHCCCVQRRRSRTASTGGSSTARKQSSVATSSGACVRAQCPALTAFFREIPHRPSLQPVLVAQHQPRWRRKKKREPVWAVRRW